MNQNNSELNIGKKAKDVTVKLIKGVLNLFSKKLIIIIAAVIILLLIIGGAYDSLMEHFSNEVTKFASEHSAKYDITDNSIQIDDAEIEELIKTLKKAGFNIESLNLTKDVIKKCYAAEIVTQELNRGETEQEGKYYGRVYVKKVSEDAISTDDAVALTYIPYEEMVGENGTIPEQSATGKEITDCFSVNSDGKLVVVRKSISIDESGNKTTTASLQELDYKSKITKYITPLEFLLNIAVASQNPEFVSSLADQILKETKIDITIMDNVTTINTTKTYQYKNATSTDTEGVIYAEVGGNFEPTGASNPKRGNPTVRLPSENSDYILGEVKTSSIESHNPSIQITNVDTWFVKCKKTYTNKISGPTENISYDELEDEVPTHSNDSYTNTSESYDANRNEKTVYRTSEIVYKVSQRYEIVTTTTNNTYIENVNESDEDDSVEGKVEEILAMLKKAYKIPGSTMKEAPINKLVNGAEIFFNMLDKSSRTQELSRLMKYILYKYNGHNYGVTDFDWDQYCISGLNEVVYGSSIGKEFTKSWENDALRKYMNGESTYSGTFVTNYITEDNTKFICYTDVNNTRNYGFGICHYTGGVAGGESNNHIDKYQALGIDIKLDEYNKLNTSLMDVDIVMTIFDQVYDEYRQAVINNKNEYAPNAPDLTEGQIVCLTDMRYQGCIIWSNFFEIYNTQDEAKIKQYILQKSEDARGQARWKAYSEETYITRGGEVLDKNKYADTSNVVSFALSLVGENHEKFTSFKPATNNITFYGNENSFEGDWCAMFVSYCYHNCGLIPSVLPRPYRGCNEYTYMKEQTTRWRYRGTYIPQPGDIIFFSKKPNSDDADHTGIVKNCDGTYVYTIEGNSGVSYTKYYWQGSHVLERKYLLNDSNIIGYFSINNN